MGIQASGKSTYYKSKFFNTHFRLSLDLLKTRNKENQFLDKCIELQQRVVIDNTNPTKSERKFYIEKFKSAKYKIVGYYFKSSVNDSLQRNNLRSGKERIKDVGILSTFKKLEIPSIDEGFDELYYVEIIKNNFEIKEWKNEI
jgi:predicted kinase